MSDMVCSYCGETIKDKEICTTLSCKGKNDNYAIQKPNPKNYKDDNKDE